MKNKTLCTELDAQMSHLKNAIGFTCQTQYNFKWRHLNVSGGNLCTQVIYISKMPKGNSIS